MIERNVLNLFVVSEMFAKILSEYFLASKVIKSVFSSHFEIKNILIDLCLWPNIYEYFKQHSINETKNTNCCNVIKQTFHLETNNCDLAIERAFGFQDEPINNPSFAC